MKFGNKQTVLPFIHSKDLPRYNELTGQEKSLRLTTLLSMCQVENNLSFRAVDNIHEIYKLGIYTI